MGEFKKIVYNALVLSMIGSPAMAQEPQNGNIGDLEKGIIHSLERNFSSEEYSNDIVYTMENIKLENGRTGTINVVYDKTEGQYRTFLLNINGMTRTGMTTIEYFIDSDMDGLRKGGHKDYFSVYDSRCGCLERGNRIDRMSKRELRQLNTRYMQQLKKINSALYGR